MAKDMRRYPRRRKTTQEDDVRTTPERKAYVPKEAGTYATRKPWQQGGYNRPEIETPQFQCRRPRNPPQ